MFQFYSIAYNQIKMNTENGRFVLFVLDEWSCVLLVRTTKDTRVRRYLESHLEVGAEEMKMVGLSEEQRFFTTREFKLVSCFLLIIRSYLGLLPISILFELR